MNTFTENDITYADGADKVTITISGKAFANLKEITETINKWAKDNYTPTEILRDFCLPDSFLFFHDKMPQASIQTFPGAIVNQLIDGDELRPLFESAGFSTDF